MLHKGWERKSGEAAAKWVTDSLEGPKVRRYTQSVLMSIGPGWAERAAIGKGYSTRSDDAPPRDARACGPRGQKGARRPTRPVWTRPYKHTQGTGTVFATEERLAGGIRLGLTIERLSHSGINSV